MTGRLARREWIPAVSQELLDMVGAEVTTAEPEWIADRLDDLVADNARIHDRDCVNLNPASNTMNPRAAAVLASGIGPRTSLGYPGAKYEMGLEAIEQIEMVTAQLAARLFDAPFVEFRVPSGASANLMAFMATTRPGEAIIVPPASIGGHVTHHTPGAAGLYGLRIHEAPIDPDRYSVDVEALARLAATVRPTLITLGASLNLRHHDVAAVRSVADDVGARVLFDAAHLSGLIAGDAWPDPLAAGAHLMTMSTYKSLAGPTAGLVLTDDAGLARRIEEIAFPGLTANFDAAKTAALAYTLNDWLACGTTFAREMVAAADALATALDRADVPVHRAGGVATESHALALDAEDHGGGMAAARRLRRANLLASAIGLPTGADRGVRIGTSELVRWGATADDMGELASLIARALHGDPTEVAPAVTDFRRRFTTVHHLAG
ncbi:MAG: beta-eliminating lyase-related protein [Actinomycetota bacterium]